MSWSVDLWDQFDNVVAHTQKGTEFCERMLHFMREKYSIEAEYATKLKRLIKNFQPKEKNEKKKEESEFTSFRGFNKMLDELSDIAGQHETVAEKLTSVVIATLQSAIHEIKQERKKFASDGGKQQAVYQSQQSQLDRAKKQYEKTFRDWEKAQEAHVKVESDVNLPRIDVEKSKQNLSAKHQSCEECKKDYAAEVAKMKTVQNEHYMTVMPRIFQQIQQADERRVTSVQTAIRQLADIEKQSSTIITKCIDGVQQASSIVHNQEDSRIVISKYKSGFHPPQDVPFEELSMTASTSTTGTLKGTVGREKRRTAIFGLFRSGKAEEQKDDFSHLPPGQQEKQLRLKIDELKASYAKEVAARDGLMKMRNVYQQNPQLGDAATLTKELDENTQTVDQLRSEISKYERFLAEMSARDVTDSQTSTPHDVIKPSAVQKSSTNEAEPTVNVTVHRHTSRLGSSRHHRSTAAEFDDSFDDDEDADDGICIALYDFTATCDGALSMKVRQEFTIVERDFGDGWIKVRDHSGNIGYVPSSYVESQFSI